MVVVIADEEDEKMAKCEAPAETEWRWGGGGMLIKAACQSEVEKGRGIFKDGGLTMKCGTLLLVAESDR